MERRPHTFWSEMRAYWSEPLWPNTVKGGGARWREFGKFLAIVTRGFLENRGPARAAALSYNTLLALVPLLAVALGVSKTFLAEREDQLLTAFTGLLANVVPQITQDPDGQQQLRETLSHSINAINAGTLGLVGSLMLIVTSLALLNAVENAFNDIWGIKRGRSPLTKVLHFWTSMSLGGLILFIAIGSTLPSVVEFFGQHRALKILSTLMPFFVLWVGFFLLYVLMPNTRVNVRAALIGGILAGTVFQLNNSLSILYASKVLSANKLYGSLGLVPILLFGLYISWLIVLVGAQIAYTLQNAKVLAREKQDDASPPNHASKELIALRVMLAIARQFLSDKPPLSASEISLRIGIPLNVVNQIVKKLVEAGLVLETVGKKSEAYVPAHALDQITAYDVLRAMRELDGRRVEPTRDEDDKLVNAIVSELYERGMTSSKNVHFLKLASAEAK